MPANADVVSVQQERVSKKLPELYETSDFLLSEFKRGAEVENVSTRDYRLPFWISDGGDYGTFSPDGGDMGLGSGPQAKHFVSSYFPIRHAIQLTGLEMDATATSEKAVAKVFSRALARGMMNLQANDDACLHVSNGVLGTATATGTDTTTYYTLDTEFATQLLRRQAKVCVYSNDLATQRAKSGDASTIEFRVSSLNISNNRCLLDTLLASPAATDKILPAGLSGASPSWKRGIPDFVNTTTSGSLLGVDRTTYPEILSNWVNASGAEINGVHGMLLLDQIEQRRDAMDEFTAVFHLKQRTGWYKVGMAISEWQRGKSDSPLDIVPKRAKNFQFAGLGAVADKHQSRTKVYVVAFKRWGRAVLRDVHWHKVGKNTVFPLRGSSGGIADGILMYLKHLSDIYTYDPGAQGLIYGLAIPTGA